MVEDVRGRAPLFFLSYAKSGAPQRITRFFADLTENVDQLVGRPVGADPGFMDNQTSGGGRWKPELLTALGQCQVLVAMLSGPYTTSARCGMEWFAFMQRKVEADTGNRSGIIPVIWAPVSLDRTPRIVREVQWFSPEGPSIDPAVIDLYESNGVFGLMTMGLEMPYQTIVWELAKRIRDLYYSQHVEPLVLNEEQLHDAFREEGP